MIKALFLLFFKLGAISIGGGYALMALIYSEGSMMVGLTAQEFADMAALELLASGPIAINAATYVGYIKGGLLGATVSTLAVITPSTIMCVLVSYFLEKYKDSLYLDSFMKAITIATGGLMLNTALILSKDIFVTEGMAIALDTINIPAIIVGILCFIGLVKFKIDPLKIVLISAVLGIIFL